MITNADLFWRWNPQPGNLWAIRSNNRYTMTESNGGGYLIIWDRDLPSATGSKEMIERIWCEKCA